HAINASLYKNLSYDPVKDFEPVALVAFLPNVLLVDPNLGVHNVQELIALLKREPKRRTFASSGNGTSTHLAGELFADLIGVPLTHVPYKGTPPAMVDVAAGQVTFMFDQMTAALPLLQAGKLRPLGVTTTQRVAAIADVPPLAEVGMPGHDTASWHTVTTTGDVPQPIIDKLAGAIREGMADPALIDTLTRDGTLPQTSPPPHELKAFVASEIVRWGKIIEQAGIAGLE
ncbi:MAG: tripartite tricarboxylate transporter substrate-binding protein, partial [Xanthobacteraceae bacterium]